MIDDQRQKENECLADCIRHDKTGEIHKHEDRITTTEREERCLRRAVWLMGAIAGLAVVGFGYSLVLLEELPPSQSRVINHIFYVVGLAALISLVVFVGLWLIRRHQLGARREECRRLVMKLLAARQTGTVMTTTDDVLSVEKTRAA